MPRTVPVNAEFNAALAALGSPEEVAGLRHGIEAALAVTPGDVLNATDYPLLGYYFTSSSEQFLAYFVTPGRFIRYEVGNGQSLTVTVALDRVSRVVEAAGVEQLTVTIELDADAAVEVFEAQTETQPNGPGSAGLVRGMSRRTRTVYELRATDHAAILQLATFSRAARSSIGL